MKNHLFIGIGGQGGRSLAELRKVMVQREDDVKTLQAQKIRWEYLSIDSSQDVWSVRKDWIYFGKDLSLGGGEKLPLQGLGSSDSLAHLATRTDVAPWLGGAKVIEGFLDGHKIPGANQRRRFGRLLFANNVVELRQAIFNDKVDRLTAANANQCCFHIFASIAGGTGSGGIVDVVNIIRAKYPDSDCHKGFPIFLYLYTTSNDGRAADVGYFYQNQYAALRDLNALMCNRLKVTILGGEDAVNPDPINAVALFSSLNSRNNVLSLPTQIRVAAESCFERIYAYTVGSFNTDSLKSLTGEDVMGTYKGEPSDNPERSYRFSSLGMRRWEVPTEQVENLLAFDLLSSALRQMRFNHWHKKDGYLAERPPLRAEVSHPYAEALLGIVTQYLLLTGSSAQIEKEMHAEVDDLLKGVRRAGVADATLQALQDKVRGAYAHTFKGKGMKAYLDDMTRQREAFIQEILQSIDQSLTTWWVDASSPLALGHVPEILALFTSSLTALLDNVSEEAETTPDFVKRLEARHNEWDKITALSRSCGKANALLKCHATDLKLECSRDIHQKCTAYDREFTKAILNSLNSLRADYASAQAVLEQLQTSADDARDMIDADVRSLQSDDSSNKYELDIKTLDECLAAMRAHKQHQDDTAYALRTVIADVALNRMMGRFRGSEAVDADALDGELLPVALERARNIHRELEQRGDIPRVLEDSIMDRLQARFAGNESLLEQECRDFVDKAASCIKYDQGPQPRELGTGPGDAPMPKRILLLGLPNHRYSATVERAIRGVHFAGDPVNWDVYQHDDRGQIRFLVIHYWMAARFAVVAKELAKLYGTPGAPGSPKGDIYYFSNIDPDGEANKRPSLLFPTADELRERFEAELWLGAQPSVGLIHANTHGVALVTATSDNMGKNVEELGESVERVVSEGRKSSMFRVHDAIVNWVKGLDKTGKAGFTQMISDEDKRIELAHGVTSPEYKNWTRRRGQLSVLLN
jgi:hypothetical protein